MARPLRGRVRTLREPVIATPPRARSQRERNRGSGSEQRPGRRPKATAINRRHGNITLAPEIRDLAEVKDLLKQGDVYRQAWDAVGERAKDNRELQRIREQIATDNGPPLRSP